jgi:FtsP/CotA-like multicopper oxidase with cupredoxin domain
MNNKGILASRRQFTGTLAASLVVLTTPRLGHAAYSAEYDQGWRVLRVRESRASLRGPDRPDTAVQGYDALVPGPLLRLKRGEELRVRIINELDDATIVHWHGVRAPNAMNGSPFLTQQPIAAGERFDYRFTPPDAGTFWYHAGPSQTARGLYGALMVDEADPVGIDRDVALVLDDWRFNSDGSVALSGNGDPRTAATESAARAITVNGAEAFDLTVKTNERIRLRLINASNARMVSARLIGHRAYVMAIDGQPSEPFIARDGRLVLGPGNRIDVFFDATLSPGTNAPLLVSGDFERPLARVVYDTGPGPAELRLDPAPLPGNGLPQRMDFKAALKRDIAIDDSLVAKVMQGAPSSPEAASVWARASQAVDRPAGTSLFSLARGRTAMLALSNSTGFPFVIHLHGHSFRLLDRLDDGWKPFWLDTIVVPAGEVVRIAFVADNPGRWAIRGQMLEHPEITIAAWFEVK